jgi:hypothetical protein
LDLDLGRRREEMRGSEYVEKQKVFLLYGGGCELAAALYIMQSCFMLGLSINYSF